MSVYGRKRKIDSCPNRLFLSYLRLWCDEARVKESKSYHTYNKAYKSLEKYPLPLQNGKEAIILENFGNKICAMLDRKLEDEASDRGMSCHEYLKQSRSVPDSWWENIEKNTKKKVKKNVSKASSLAYIPLKNSGAYALLLTLHKQTDTSWLSKTELMRLAQPLATKSFIVPDGGSYYTAWSSMTTLLSKNLVKKFGNPAKFEITEEGRRLASLIEAGEKNSASVQNNLNEKGCVCGSSKTWELSDSDSDGDSCGVVHAFTSKFHASSYAEIQNFSSDMKAQHIGDEVLALSHKVDLTLTSSDGDTGEDTPRGNKAPLQLTLDRHFCLFAGSFRVALCVDSREIRGDKRKNELRRHLDLNGLDYVERILQVGDFIWLAQETGNHPRVKARELVLDYVVERKCMSDLAQSIRDKRFREQKIRLKQCGLSKVIYLAEETKQIDHQSLPESTLRQALVNTMLVDQIYVKYTEDLAETAKYLKSMTDKLSVMYSSKTLRSCDLSDAKFRVQQSHGSLVFDLLPFDDFNDDSMKSKGLTAGELFIKQLMQIHGMSYHKAHAIALAYSTPFILYKAYQACSNCKERESLLSKIKFGPSQRNIGISVSRSVCHVFASS